MDTIRFDALVRSLLVQASRRGALGTALLGTLGALGFATERTEAKKRKRKKKKKCRGCPTCRQCVKGRCRPIPDFTPCGGVCQECQGGQCVNKADDSVCNEEGKCLDGDCSQEPACTLAGVSGCDVIQNCCSDVCEGIPPLDTCQPGPVGALCRRNSDCESDSCIGYRCAA